MAPAPSIQGVAGATARQCRVSTASCGPGGSFDTMLKLAAVTVPAVAPYRVAAARLERRDAFANTVLDSGSQAGS